MHAKLSALTILLAVSAGAPWALAQQAVSDSSFGSGGLSSISIPTTFESWNAIAVQPDGRIVVAGARSASLSGNGPFIIARYLSTGVLDTSFGAGGIVNLSLNNAKTIALQPDGKILVGGDNSVVTREAAGIALRGPADLEIARLNPNGSLDTTFGVGGIVRTDLSGGGLDTVSTLLVLPSGNILAVGSASNSRGGLATNWSIIGYTSSGAINTAFGAGGRAQIDFGVSIASAVANDAILQGSNVVIAGTSGVNFVAARIDSTTGALDPTFGTGGATTITFPDSGQFNAQATSVITQPDGRLVLVGDASFFDADAGDVSPPLIRGARLTASGQIDPTFSAFPNNFVTAPRAIARVAGNRTVVSVGGIQLVRLNTDGSFDQTFSQSGGQPSALFTNAALGSASASVLAVQADGRVLMGGTRYVNLQSDTALARVVVDGTVQPPPPPTAPAAPSSLAAGSVTIRSVALTWRDNSSNETQFVVQRSASSNFANPTTLATLSANATSYTDSSVAARTTYYYRVSAANAAGSSVSSILAVTTPRR